MDLLDTCR